jgi:hypothetical protein
MRQYPATSICLQNLLIEYERIASDVARTAALYFQPKFCLKYRCAQGRWSRCARSSSIDANRIMPSGICASIEPSEYNE